jgi:hypothetical protein
MQRTIPVFTLSYWVEIAKSLILTRDIPNTKLEC